MLQLNMTVCTITNRFTFRALWRLNASLSTNAAPAVPETVTSDIKFVQQLKKATSNVAVDREQHAQFNALKTELCKDLNIEPSVTNKIKNAKHVHDLLELMKGPVLSQHDISKAMSMITEWINKNSETSSPNKNKTNLKQNNTNETKTKNRRDKSTIDFSKYTDYSTSQMIKEICKLTTTGDRNIKLLNYLFQNIVEYSSVLSPGACSNLLYSMCILNFSDERLLKKICNDLTNHLIKENMTISIVTLSAVVKSLSILRYKDYDFLMHVCTDIVSNRAKYRLESITQILHSFAMLGYNSDHVNNILQLYMPNFTMKAVGRQSNWLNLIWSLVVFQKAETSHVMSVLNEPFLSRLMYFEKKLLPYQLKLLNINSYAKYALKQYTGPFLESDVVPHLTAKRSKQKVLYINALEETLKNLLPSPSHFEMNINTQMGFLLGYNFKYLDIIRILSMLRMKSQDAVLYLDSERKVVHIDKDMKKENLTKVGILIVDYYDTCLGDSSYQGLMQLYIHLLTCAQYDVMCVPYQHFGIEDTLEKRAYYLRKQLWNKYMVLF